MSVTLNTGASIPTIGYGTWQAAPGEVGAATEVAVKAGYKHLDFAKVYENQVECGQGMRAGLKAAGLKREDLFLTSKLWNSSHSPELVEAALDNTLAELGVDFLDLYLIHWPVPFVPTAEHTSKLFPRDPKDNDKVAISQTISVIDTWKAMIALPKSKVRAIGVSNFTTASIDALIAATGVTPAAHQIERHPLLPQPELVAHHKAAGIHITAYSPLGNNNEGHMKLFDYSEIKAIAAEMSQTGAQVTPAQVLISWGAIGGHSVIPKSVTPSRIESNLVQVTLTAEHVKRIEALGASKPFRFNVPINYKPQWFINVFNEPSERVSPVAVRTA